MGAHDPITHFLDRLALITDAEERHDAFVGECQEAGGSYIVPPAGDLICGTHFVEISVHEVTGRGESSDEAQRDWIQAAARLAGWIEPAH